MRPTGVLQYCSEIKHSSYFRGMCTANLVAYWILFRVPLVALPQAIRQWQRQRNSIDMEHSRPSSGKQLRFVPMSLHNTCSFAANHITTPRALWILTCALVCWIDREHIRVKRPGPILADRRRVGILTHVVLVAVVVVVFFYQHTQPFSPLKSFVLFVRLRVPEG